MVLAVDTRTVVVMFFFTGDTDLLFSVAMLSTRRKMDRSVGRRGLTFASGFLPGELDLDLFVGLCGCLDLSGGFVVLVRRGEDAEGNGYSGFKIQIADLY